ncbi:hypothetical protein [Micromonospora sp. NPDC005220]|uniref:hypothetical protein n=1 Tax=Micromonospora sp. NPDC005220 TaxID=3155589 RepID=UPI0033B65FE9
MNRGPVLVAVSTIVVGVTVVVVGAVGVASGDAALVGAVGFGAVVAIIGVVLLREANRAARMASVRGRRRRADGGGYSVYPGPTGDAGSGHVSRQRDGDDGGPDDPQPVGGDPGGGWSGGDSGGGRSGDSGGAWSGGDSGGGWSGGDSGGGWSGGGGDSGGGGGGS